MRGSTARTSVVVWRLAFRSVFNSSKSAIAENLIVSMLAVTFRGINGETHLIEQIPSEVTLRDLQKKLCKAFHVPFPSTQATLEIEGVVYDDFEQHPFLDYAILCDGASAATDALVLFEPTTDLFWFDWNDRRKPECTVEEEIAYEDALALGHTDLVLYDWLQKHRRSSPSSPEVRTTPIGT